MGSWGVGIKQNDTVCDVVDFIDDQLKDGHSLENACRQAGIEFSELKIDYEDGPLFYIALAFQQWKYGQVDSSLLDIIRNDITTGRSLQGWEEESKLVIKRKDVLLKFLAKIETVNPKPSPFPKKIIRKAYYKKGDCLSVLLPDGRYSAAIVLVEDNSNPEYGKNLVGSLDYLDNTPPTLDVFRQKKWLILNFASWKNEKVLRWYPSVSRKKEIAHLSLVANISLSWLDPKDSKSFTAWANLGKSVIPHRDSLKNKQA